MNKLMSIGNLTRDPEIKDIGGNTCCNFTIASDSRNKDANGNNTPNFYQCSAWGKSGETIARYMKKGNKIAIIGDVAIRNYKDNNGNDRTAVCVTVTDFEFLRSGSASNDAESSAPASAPAKRPAPTPVAVPDDTLPF